MRVVSARVEAAVSGVRTRTTRSGLRNAGDPPFDLVGTTLGALVAVAWAAAHPKMVRRLVLYGSWADGSALSLPTVQDHLLGLIESHWGLGSDVLTDIFAPDADAATRVEFARYQRATSSAAMARALLALCYQLDVRDLLTKVRAPTLVVHRAHDRAAPSLRHELSPTASPDRNWWY